MAFMTWDNSLNVQVPEMDEQHKKLVGLVNQFHDAMKSGKGKDAIGATLKALIDYTKTHFASEEALQQKRGFSGAAEHKKMHDDLTQQVVALQQKFEANEPISSAEVLSFLRDWLINHIKKEDKQYGVEISAKQAEAATA